MINMLSLLFLTISKDTKAQSFLNSVILAQFTKVRTRITIVLKSGVGDVDNIASSVGILTRVQVLGTHKHADRAG